MRSGIYKITAPNGNCYVGSTVKFNKRWSSHRRALDKGVHHSPVLQAAWRKYGGDSFKFEKLLVCRIEDLLFFEQRAIDAFNPRYNIHRVAGSAYGHKHSEATRGKISTANKGRRPSDAAIEAAVKANTGRKCSPETAAKRKTMLGRTHSDEVKARISASNAGQKRSLETREKIRSATTGRLASDSAKRNMSAAHTGRKASPEARANMVEAQRLIRERKSARLTTLIDFDLLTNPADGL